MSWAEIIEYRQQFYVQNYDIRIICEHYEAPTSVAEKIVKRWNTFDCNKYYISTRKLPSLEDEVTSFLEVVIQGLASNGGLFVPKGDLPRFTLGKIYCSVAWFVSELPEKDILNVVVQCG